jgi:hypothetical protein
MPRMTAQVATTPVALWHTLTIQVPKDMITFTPSGRVSVRPTLTKLHNLSKSQGKTAIRLMKSPDNKAHVITDGKTYTHQELKGNLRQVDLMEKVNKRKVRSKVFATNAKKHAEALVDRKLGINPRVKGYTWNNQRNKWWARIRMPDGRQRHLGFFNTEEEAHNAYLVAKREERRAVLALHNVL